MRRYVRQIAMLLALLALLFVLTSSAFTTVSCHHICTGSHCPVCLQVRLWHAVMRLFGVLLVCAFACAVCAAGVFAARFAHARRQCRTPVALKIKLLN